MNPTSFNFWTRTVAVFLTLFTYFSLQLHAQVFYDDSSARRLKITPKDCTSLRYPNVIGTCMFNLECKEKLGTVIGACVDRFLFGACCHFQNVTTTTQRISETTTQFDSNNPESKFFNEYPTTDTPTIQSVPLLTPNHNPSKHDNPSNNFPQTMDPLPIFNNPSQSGILSLLPPSPELTTFLPVPLETFTHGSHSSNISPHRINDNQHSKDSRFPVTLEYSTLKIPTYKYDSQETTEDPPRLSTFMYVDGFDQNDDGFEGKEVEENLNITTTAEAPILSESGTESLWSIVHQLVPVPSNAPQIKTGVEIPLNSDELYTVLSGKEPEGSVMENKIHVIPDPVWKMTTTEDLVSSSSTSSPPRPNTNRPWASSTYQIHTFKYPPPVTTTFPSGIVTWNGILEEPKSTTTSSTTTTTSTSTTTTTTTTTEKPKPIIIPPPPPPPIIIRTTTKPVAEVTVPPSTTTTTTTTTEKPTTTTMTTTPLPKKKPIKPIIQKIENPSKKPEVSPQPGILQSDFDENIDNFVNQVVQELAGSFGNLDLDEVILHPPEPSSPANEELPPTLHPLHVLSDPLFPPFPLLGQIPLTKPGKTGISGSSRIPPSKKITTTTTSTTTMRPLDYRKDCGVRPLNKQGRIVGGNPSKFGKWPWQALVREATWLGLFSKNKCGGVLISPKYVLTAAHCQPGFLATLTVVLGDFDISSETEGSGLSNKKNSNSITKNVRRVIVHRDYNAQTFENDIALLELDTPVDYQPHVVPICLPVDDEVLVGQQAIVTGWGRLKYGGGVPNTLHEVDVPILNNTECQNMFLKSGHIKAIRDSFICAGYANGLKDSCEGDSGGPLAIMRPNGQWMLAGTVSHGIKCAYPNLPGVYMRMTYYKPWIKRVTGVTT